MLKALLYKELRETIPIALVALLCYFVVIMGETGHSVLPFLGRTPNAGQVLLPFISDGFLGGFGLISAGLAIALGLRQTAFESGRGTWLFLLHRPITKWDVLAVKMATGIGLYLLCGAIAILVYIAWAATPGTHASPFFWWLTVPAWKTWIALVLVYLGAFLSGIRPGRWIGTRLLPLAASGLGAGLLAAAPWLIIVGLVAFLLLAAYLAGLSLFVARVRDFS